MRYAFLGLLLCFPAHAYNTWTDYGLDGYDGTWDYLAPGGGRGTTLVTSAQMSPGHARIWGYNSDGSLSAIVNVLDFDCSWHQSRDWRANPDGSNQCREALPAGVTVCLHSTVADVSTPITDFQATIIGAWDIPERTTTPHQTDVTRVSSVPDGQGCQVIPDELSGPPERFRVGIALENLTAHSLTVRVSDRNGSPLLARGHLAIASGDDTMLVQGSANPDALDFSLQGALSVDPAIAPRSYIGMYSGPAAISLIVGGEL